MIPFVYKLGGAALFITCAWLYVTDLRHDRDSARVEAAQAHAEAKAAHAQADLNNTASGALEAAQSRSLSITVKAQELSHAAAIAPGGDELVPSGVLERWGNGIDQLRNEAAGAHAPADPGSAGAAGPVPTPDPAG